MSPGNDTGIEGLVMNGHVIHEEKLDLGNGKVISFSQFRDGKCGPNSQFLHLSQ